MERRTFIKQTSAAGLITLISPSSFIATPQKQTGSTLEEAFLRPLDKAFPQAYWFWMNGNVTKEGITLDLEAMKRVGIGGVFNFDVGTGIPKGPVDYLSSKWLELKKHAIREAGRLGLEFTLHNCPGWSASGGPWITPELSMQQVTWSEAFVAGGRNINIKLPQPPKRLNYYKDIVILAYPSLEGEDQLQTLKASSSSGPVHVDQVTGVDPEGAIVHPPEDNVQAWLELQFKEFFEARLISFFISAIPPHENINLPLEFGERTSITLEASDDGVSYRVVTAINTGLETELFLGDKYIAFDIPVTKAKFFRLSSSKTRRYRQVQLSGITRLKNWMEKGNHRGRNITFVSEASSIHHINHQEVPKGSIIDIQSIIDITQFADQDGMLHWNAPEGNWTILRIGFTPTGTLNRAAPETGIGLECDKYNRSAFTFHFHKMMESLLPIIKPLAIKGKAGLEIDSYEAGTQNWTPGFEQEFIRQRIYDLVKYLPSVTGGRIVGNVDITERFLWDFRKVQANLIAENYYQQFHQLCAQHKITSYIEPYEMGPMEEMQIGSKVNVNIGEFWYGISTFVPIKRPTLRTPKLATSIAHINGQKVTGAEAFTAAPDSSKWQEYPFSLKAAGDKVFTKGVNRLIIHRFAHQPHPTVLPGMTMGPWGIHFDRTNTWWDQSKGWLSYLTRCQSMLQQGQFVADLVYFTGEDANMYTMANPDEISPTPPEGYDYDLIHSEALFKQVQIRNHKIVLTNGMTYQVFVLQNYQVITLALLRKLRQLIKEGMIMIGAKPERSAGLVDFKDDDREFKQIVNELWGDIDGHRTSEHQYGEGRVIWGQTLSRVLQNLNIQPDFSVTSRSGDAPIIYIHRKLKEADFYFISNQRRTFEEVVCTFRVANMQPELWDAVTGEISSIPIYEISDERIRIPLQLEPYGSAIIVFRATAQKNHLHAIIKDNEPILSTANFSPRPRRLYNEVTNSFAISLWAKPEMNVLLNPSFIMGTIKKPWTEYYTIYPTSGKALYGEGHANCGLTIGQNGVAVWENTSDDPVLVLAVPIAISGWSHIVLQYEANTPSIFVNGKRIQKGQKSFYITHPGTGEAFQSEGASYYSGDMTNPELFTNSLRDEEILILANQKPDLPLSPFSIESAVNSKPAFMIKQNGNYVFDYSNGKKESFLVSNIHPPIQLEGPWDVYFPRGFGAPARIELPKLVSLHQHSEAGVKYFSGTAAYHTSFILSKGMLSGNRWLLDLGQVEVLAQVSVNNKDLGILWKRPYRIDITDALSDGRNKLVIKVTNQWSNRLIGDEQHPETHAFTAGGNSSGMESLTSGYIEQLPSWYVNGKLKPQSRRITFTTWKHYTKDSPLLTSGLIGPVMLEAIIIRQL